MASPAQIATAWASAALVLAGCTLHAVPGGAWDVEFADGHWQAASDWRELCRIARRAR